MKIYKLTSINSQYNKNILFPTNELDQIKDNLKSTGIINTLRTDKEFNKYYLNEILSAPQFNINLQVIEIKQLSSYKEYQYYEYLSKEQSDYLKTQENIEHLKLKII